MRADRERAREREDLGERARESASGGMEGRNWRVGKSEARAEASICERSAELKSCQA